MKRYDPMPGGAMEEYAWGDYVKYEDIEVELEYLKAIRDNLREKMEQIHNIAYDAF
jgi:hypothetical protein